MALDRHSLREDFDACQKTFERLREEDEMSPAVIALVESMLVLMKLMVALFLEKTTKQDELATPACRVPRSTRTRPRRSAAAPRARDPGRRRPPPTTHAS